MSSKKKPRPPPQKLKVAKEKVPEIVVLEHHIGKRFLRDIAHDLGVSGGRLTQILTEEDALYEATKRKYGVGSKIVMKEALDSFFVQFDHRLQAAMVLNNRTEVERWWRMLSDVIDKLGMREKLGLTVNNINIENATIEQLEVVVRPHLQQVVRIFMNYVPTNKMADASKAVDEYLGAALGQLMSGGKKHAGEPDSNSLEQRSDSGGPGGSPGEGPEGPGRGDTNPEPDGPNSEPGAGD